MIADMYFKDTAGASVSAITDADETFALVLKKEIKKM